jgi:hypothetical protein
MGSAVLHSSVAVKERFQGKRWVGKVVGFL